MALTRAQLLMGDGSQGVVLPGQPQAVTAGIGISIDPSGSISVNSQSVIGLMKLGQTAASAAAAYNSYEWPTAPGNLGQNLVIQSVGGSTALVWSDPGVTSINAGTGITVSGSTGSVTISVNPTQVVTQLNAGSNISLSGSTGNITISGQPGTIIGVAAGDGLSGGGTSGTVTLSNAGVTGLTAGSNINLSGSTGNVTISSTAGGTISGITAGTGLSGGGTSGTVTLSVDPSQVVTGIAAGSANITVTGNVGNITIDLNANPSVSSLQAGLTVKANDVSIGLYTPGQGTKIIWNADSGTGATFFDNDRGGGAGGFRFREITTGGTVVQALLSLSSFEGLIVKSSTDQFAIQLRPSGDIGVGPAGALQFGATGQVLASQGAGNPATWCTFTPTINAATPLVQGAVLGCTTALNTGLGANALLQNPASASVGIGINALTNLVSGTGNLAIGVNAACSATAASSIIAIGNSALCAVTTGSQSSIAIGNSTLMSTAGGTAFCNIAIGHNTAPVITNGFSNVAIGNFALAISTNSDCTIAIGECALAVLPGTGPQDGNVAIGYRAAALSTNMSQSVAIGANAGQAEFQGVSVGSCAGVALTTGGGNTILGASAGVSLTTGVSNTIIGIASGNLALTTGSGNTYLGGCNSQGAGNGSDNTSVGYSFCASRGNGSRNTTIGTNQCSDGSGATNGFVDISGLSDQVLIGGPSTTNAYIMVEWTVVSDERDKNVLGPVPHGLDFVEQLEPKAFNFKVSRTDDTPHGATRYGFLAQDILPLEGESPVLINSNDPEKLTYTNAYMIPILVNAVKELSSKLAAMQIKLDAASSNFTTT